MSRHYVINGKPRHISGWKKQRPDHKDVNYHLAVSAAPLASSIDLRPEAPRIEDQGEIGSCTANASTSAMEYVYAKAGKPVIQMSRLFLYFATRVWTEGTPATEDSGAQIRDVMTTLAKYGCCSEDTMPYAPENFSAVPTTPAIAEAMTHLVTKYYACPNLRAIKTAMASGYPCVGGFSVPASMMSDQTAKTGMVQMPQPEEEFVGGHAILFVGYDDSTRLLTFENSWGTGWGAGGFGFLPYGYVQEGLADDFWCVTQENM